MQLNSNMQVTQERAAVPPSLLAGEDIQFSSRLGSSPTWLVGSLLLTMVPPFIFGLLLFAILSFFRRSDGIWITNHRLVYWQRMPLGGQYLVKSVPLRQISKVRMAPLASSLDFFEDLIDRLMGTGDVQVFLVDGAEARIDMAGVKEPGQLVERLKSAIDSGKAGQA